LGLTIEYPTAVTGISATLRPYPSGSTLLRRGRLEEFNNNPHYKSMTFGIRVIRMEPE
jgi:hypothetical protein